MLIHLPASIEEERETIMIRSLAHIGIAVKSLSVSSEVFSRLFGVRAGHVEEVPDQKVRTVHFSIGSSRIELLEPTSPDSAVARFLEKSGEGVHHLSFEVDDIETEIARLQAEGFRMIDEHARPGAGGYRVAFVHPKSALGVLIEISQKGQ